MPGLPAIGADLCPGDHEKGLAKLQDATLLKRCVDPAEVAGLMLLLASDTGSFCAGGMYMIDGGMQYCLRY